MYAAYHYTALHCVASDRITECCIVSYRILLYCIVLYSVLPNSVMMHCGCSCTPPRLQIFSLDSHLPPCHFTFLRSAGLNLRSNFQLSSSACCIPAEDLGEVLHASLSTQLGVLRSVLDFSAALLDVFVSGFQR